MDVLELLLLACGLVAGAAGKLGDNATRGVPAMLLLARTLLVGAVLVIVGVISCITGGLGRQWRVGDFPQEEGFGSYVIRY